MRKEVDIADYHKVACPTKEQRASGQEASTLSQQLLCQLAYLVQMLLTSEIIWFPG